MRNFSYVLGVLIVWLSNATFANTWIDPVTKIEWTYTTSGGKASVGSGNYGSGRAVPSSTIGAIAIPPSLGSCPVVSIASYAFYGCGGLTDVTIPSSVTNISYEAFRECWGLTNVTMSSSMMSIGFGAFRNCRGLESIGIPLGVTSIAGYAFSGCSALTSVKIPSGVTRIRDYVFYDCSSLTNVVMTSNITSIGDCAFCNCSRISNLYIPTNVTVIGGTAFGGCLGLTNITIPSSVTAIGDYAFSNCGELRSVSLSENLKNIAMYAFSGCSNLVSITIPRNVTTIGQFAFQDCPKLAYLAFEGMPPSILSATGIGTSDGVGIFYPSEHKINWQEALDYWQNVYGIFRDGSFFAVGDWQDNESSRGYLWRSFANVDYATSITWQETDTSIPCFSVMLSGESTSIIEFKTIRDGLFQAILGASAESGWFANVKLYIDGLHIGTIGTSQDYFIAENFQDGKEHIIRCVLSHPGCEDDAPYSTGYLRYVIGTTNPIQVAFDSVGGTPKTQTVWRVNRFTMQSLSDIQDPVRKGYRFGGWYTDSVSGIEVTANTTTLDDALVFYAHWQAETMRVCYDAAGGYFNFSSTYRPSIYDEYPDYDTALPSVKEPEREGYKFIGWYTEADGGTLVEANTIVRSYMHLYAHWKSNPFSVSYSNTRGVENPNPTAYTTGDHIVFAALQDVADAHFVGWEPASIEIESSGDLVVTAIWETKELVDLLTDCGNVSGGGDVSWRTEWIGSSWVLRSGSIGDRQQSALLCSVVGAGVLTFKWKVSSECAAGYKDDYLSFEIDGSEVAWMGGEQGWAEKRFELASDAQHTFKWMYSKDKSGKAGDDCGWLKDVVWTSTDPIPKLSNDATPQEVAAALDGSADTRLKECITNAANYNAYRVWATNVKTADGSGKAGAKAVSESIHAWISFAVGSDKLISELPKSEDIKVDVFSPSTKSGKFDFTVSVDGLTVSNDALKENLKQVFGLEGSTTLQPNGFSSNNVDIDFGTPNDGKVKFTAGPNAENFGASSFFMKVKLNN